VISVLDPFLPSYIRSTAGMRATLSSGALASNVSDGQALVIDQSKADHTTDRHEPDPAWWCFYTAAGGSGLVTRDN